MRESSVWVSAGTCHQANNSAPAWVNFTYVPDSWITSQPSSIARLRPARLYEFKATPAEYVIFPSHAP
jgi:hypothetical protein